MGVDDVAGPQPGLCRVAVIRGWERRREGLRGKFEVRR